MKNQRHSAPPVHKNSRPYRQLHGSHPVSEKHGRGGQSRKASPRHKGGKKSHFMRNLLLFAGIALMGIFLVLFRLWNYLADYQNTLPSMLGDEILSAYRSADTTTIKKYCTTLPDSLQDDMTFHRYLDTIIGKEDIYYYESNTQNDSEGKAVITYTYSVDNQTFATLVVSRTASESKYGFPLYEISSLEQYTLQSYTFIQAPGTQILLNGIPIDASYLKTQETIASSFDEIEAGPFAYTTYVLPDYLASSDVTSIDASGNRCELTWNKEHTVCISTNTPRADIASQISSFATDAAKEYAVFATIKYASRDSLLAYLYPGTTFYKAIKTYDNDWGISKTSDSFDSVTVTDTIQYSPTEYSCVVSLDYLVKQGSTEKNYPLSFTCYITTKNGSPKIVNLETNAINDKRD